MSRERDRAIYQEKSRHLFPIPTYSREQPSATFPTVESYVDTLSPDTSHFLHTVINDEYFLKNMVKLQRKILSRDLSISAHTSMSNFVKGFGFEIGAHAMVKDAFKNEPVIVSSPEETNMLYDVISPPKIKKTRTKTMIPRKQFLLQEEGEATFMGVAKKPSWTKPDTILFVPQGDKTLILGGGEFTTRTSIGDFRSPYRYMNRDKINQYRYHNSGKVISDFFANQTDEAKQRLGEKVSGLYGISDNLTHNPDLYHTIFVVPSNDPRPVTPKTGELMFAPVTNGEMDEFAVLCMQEMQDYPISSHSGFDIAAGD